jgi:hypothetical protein
MSGIEEIGHPMPSRALLREMKVPYVSSPLYDEMPAPRTFAELMVCLEEIRWSSGHPGCWLSPRWKAGCVGTRTGCFSRHGWVGTGSWMDEG